MLTIRKYADLGTMQISWLNAHYHYSFANYHDPRRMGLGPLRVINDDIVKAGGGFDMHPHRDMEIITYVRKGAIAHRDSLGNEGRTDAGDVQVMSAGTGIVHAEYNEGAEDTNLYQIWIHPRAKSVAPRWDQRAFPKSPVEGELPLLVSGLEDHREIDALFIHADAAIYGGVIAQGKQVRHNLKGSAYLLVSRGSVLADGQRLEAGDGAEITAQDALTLQAQGGDSEVVLIDLPLHHA